MAQGVKPVKCAFSFSFNSSNVVAIYWSIFSHISVLLRPTLIIERFRFPSLHLVSNVQTIHCTVLSSLIIAPSSKETQGQKKTVCGKICESLCLSANNAWNGSGTPMSLTEETQNTIYWAPLSLEIHSDVPPVFGRAEQEEEAFKGVKHWNNF